MTWPSGQQPFGVNRGSLLSGLASDGSGKEIPVAVDKTTGGILISGGGSGGTSSTFSAAFPSTGTAVGASDGTNMKPLLVDASGYLEVNVKAGSGSGLSVQDAAAWTAGSSNFVPGGGVFNDSATALTSGQQGTQRLTPNRAEHVNIRNQAGTEMGTSSNPFQVTGANGTFPVTGTFWQSTQPVSIASLPALATGSNTIGKVDILGNGGATLDAGVGANTAPSNMLAVGGIYNSTAPAPTSGQSMASQLDQAGNQRIFPGIALTTLSAWNNGTSINATQTIYLNSGAPAVLVQLDITSTITAGAVLFEVTYDGTNWVTIPANCVVDPTSTSYAQITLPYVLIASTNKPFLLTSNGWQGLRIKLSVAILGTGAVTPYYALLPFNPVTTVTIDNATISENVAQFGGSNVVTGTGASGSGIPRVTVSSDSTVGANSATGSAVPANAFYNGLQVRTSLPSAGSNGNLVGAYSDKFGRAVTIPQTTRDLVGVATITITSSTLPATLIAAAGSGIFTDILDVRIINTSATATEVQISDGTNTYEYYVPAGDMRGVVLQVPDPATTANTAWTATTLTSVASVKITVKYAKNQ